MNENDKLLEGLENKVNENKSAWISKGLFGKKNRKQSWI